MSPEEILSKWHTELGEVVCKIENEGPQPILIKSKEMILEFLSDFRELETKKTDSPASKNQSEVNF